MRVASDPVAGTVEGEGVGAPIAPRRVGRGTGNKEASEEHRIARGGLDRGGHETVDVPFEPDAKGSGIQPRVIDGALQVTPLDETNTSICQDPRRRWKACNSTGSALCFAISSSPNSWCQGVRLPSCAAFMSSFEWYLMMSGEPMSWRTTASIFSEWRIRSMVGHTSSLCMSCRIRRTSSRSCPRHMRSVLQPRVVTGLALGDRKRRHLLVKILGLAL